MSTKKAKIVADYQHVFIKTEQGRRVLKDLMLAHSFVRPTFSENAMEMARNEGERNVVLRILSLLNIDAQELFRVLDEMDREQKAEGAVI